MSKHVKKAADDVLEVIDTQGLSKLNYAAELSTKYSVPSGELPNPIHFPEQFAEMAEPFPFPTIFGKEPVAELKIAFPFNTQFNNGKTVPEITQKEPEITQVVSEFEEKEIVDKMFSQTALNELREQKHEISQNQFEVLAILVSLEHLAGFSLNNLISNNIAQSIDKSGNLYFEVQIKDQKVNVSAGNTEGNYYLQEYMEMNTPEGEYTSSLKYGSVLNEVFDNSEEDFYELLASTAKDEINSFYLPIHLAKGYLEKNRDNTAVFAVIGNFYEALGERANEYFNRSAMFSSYEEKSVKLQIISSEAIKDKVFYKISCPDPIIAVLLNDKLSDEEQDELQTYQSERELKMQRFIERELNIKSKGKITVSFEPFMEQSENNSIQTTQVLEKKIELPELRKYKDEEEEDEKLKTEEQKVKQEIKEQYEEIYIESGADDDLYCDSEELENMNYFYISLETLCELCSELEVYEFKNSDNLLLVNEKKCQSINLSISQCESAIDKETGKEQSTSETIPNIETYILQCNDDYDVDAVLTFKFNFLQQNTTAKISVSDSTKELKFEAADHFTLNLGDFDSKMLVLKFEFLLAKKLSKTGALLLLSGFSSRNTKVAFSALQQRIDEKNFSINRTTFRTLPALPGYSSVILAAQLLFGQPSDSSEESDIDIPILSNQPINVADLKTEVEFARKQVVSRARRERCSSAECKQFDSAYIWVSFDDGCVELNQYSVTITNAENSVLISNKAMILNNQQVKSAVPIPLEYIEQQSGRPIYLLLHCQESIAVESTKNPRSNGVFPQNVTVFCSSPRQCEIVDAQLQRQEYECQLTQNEAYSLSSTPGSLVMVQFFERQQEALESRPPTSSQARAETRNISKSSSSVKLEQEKSSSKLTQGEQHEDSQEIREEQVVARGPDEPLCQLQQILVEKPAPPEKGLAPKLSAREAKTRADVLQENASIIEEQSRDPQVLQSMELHSRGLLFFDVQCDIELVPDKTISAVIYTFEQADLSMQLLSVPNVILQRIAQQFYSKESVQAADYFRKNCQLQLNGVQADIAKLQLSAQYRGAAEIAQQKKKEILTNPTEMAEQAIKAQKQIVVEANDDVFGAERQKASAKKAKTDGGMLSEICGQLKAGVDRGQIEELFRIEEK